MRTHAALPQKSEVIDIPVPVNTLITVHMPHVKFLLVSILDIISEDQ